MRHTDPADCAAILNAIVASYKEFTREQSGETGDLSVETLQRKQDDAKSELDALTVQYEKFRSDHPELIGNQADRINPYQEEIKRLNDSLGEIRSHKIETACRIDTVRRLLSHKVEDELAFDRFELIPEIAGKTGRPEMAEAAKAEVNELWQMMLREAVLLKQHGTGHPLVQRNRAAIDEMKRLLVAKRRQMLRDFAHLLVSDLRELKRREIEESKLLNAAMKKATELDEAVREDERYLNRLTNKQKDYTTARSRLDEAIMGRGHGAIITKTLAPVAVGEPINTSPVVILALGMMVGLVIGMGLAVVSDNLDAGAVHEAEARVTRQPRAMNGSKLQHIRPNVGAAV
jgi:hypothetical protein